METFTALTVARQERHGIPWPTAKTSIRNSGDLGLSRTLDPTPVNRICAAAHIGSECAAIPGWRCAASSRQARAVVGRRPLRS